jgi:hypothetical protein
MPRKPRKRFQAGSEARRIARQVVGSPPPQRVLADKRAKPPKHKKTLREQIEP